MQINKNQIWKFIKESNRIEGIELEEQDFIAAVNAVADTRNPNHVHAVNSMQACEYVLENYNTELGFDDIMCLHELQMGDQLADSDLGVIRKTKVGIRKSTFDETAMMINMSNVDKGVEDDILPTFKTEIIPCTPPGQIRDRLDQFIYMFNKNSTDNLSVHYEFECIHPFIDGNGRVGRLLWMWRGLRKGSSNILLLEEYEEEGFFDRRKAYYDAIQNYRDTQFMRRKSGEGRSTKRRPDRRVKKSGSSVDAENAISDVR